MQFRTRRLQTVPRLTPFVVAKECRQNGFDHHLEMCRTVLYNVASELQLYSILVPLADLRRMQGAGLA